jgi:hypothetical protein
VIGAGRQRITAARAFGGILARVVHEQGSRTSLSSDLRSERHDPAHDRRVILLLACHSNRLIDASATISFSEACQDPALFQPWFAGPSWATWSVVHKAMFGEPLTESEMVVFQALTGRNEAPTELCNEVWIIAGRRAGKDVTAAAIVVYLATIGAERFGYSMRLVRGERGTVQLLAVDRSQAQVCFSYIRAMLEQPLLAQLVANVTAETIELSNGLTIEVTTNDRRRVRGRTVVAVVFDEVAHWRSETTVNPDTEVYSAIKPAMATIPHAMLIGISSPYARRGLLWTKHQKHFGQFGNVLVVKAATWTLNPSLPRNGEFISAQYAAWLKLSVSVLSTQQKYLANSSTTSAGENGARLSRTQSSTARSSSR